MDMIRAGDAHRSTLSGRGMGEGQHSETRHQQQHRQDPARSLTHVLSSPLRPVTSHESALRTMVTLTLDGGGICAVGAEGLPRLMSVVCVASTHVLMVAVSPATVTDEIVFTTLPVWTKPAERAASRCLRNRHAERDNMFAQSSGDGR